jgi:hypothetical protein
VSDFGWSLSPLIAAFPAAEIAIAVLVGFPVWRILVLRGMFSDRDRGQAAVTPASQPIRPFVIMVNGFLLRLPF